MVCLLELPGTGLLLLGRARLAVGQIAWRGDRRPWQRCAGRTGQQRRQTRLDYRIEYHAPPAIGCAAGRDGPRSVAAGAAAAAVGGGGPPWGGVPRGRGCTNDGRGGGNIVF